MKEYNHARIEKNIQKEWEKKKIYQAKNGKGKEFYSLIEFPYPSGDGMHVGHIRSNTAMDIISRKRRMEGYNVLYPIGWDAFGLPTENYAIKTGKKPSVVTKKNTDTFRRQLKALGFSFDWSREINTTDPKYYKWTQWIFLQFFKKRLAYKARSYINWCLSCKIGLANEEVVNGKCERCGGDTEKREKEQWMLAITKYADRLHKDLDDVNYLEKIKIQQRNWIGKSEGSEIEFAIKDQELRIKVFTTRADTLFGATYLVLAPEHSMVGNLKSQITNWNEVSEYVKKSKGKTEIDRTDDKKEKTGVELKGIKAINPANNEEISVWVSDYVLADYGTGALMAVPAHDGRDNEFARKYDLTIKEVIEPFYISETDRPKEGLPFVERNAIHAIVKHWSEAKYLILFWKKGNWITFVTGGIEAGEDPIQSAIREIKEETGYLNPVLVKELCRSHEKFYHILKKENRFVHFTHLYFELKNGERVELSEEEKEKHEPRWLTPEEISKILNEAALRDWETFQGKRSIYAGEGILANSGRFDGLYSAEAKKKITEFVGGKVVTKFKLRDWVFSRQRYWGEPIPLIFCENCAKKDSLGSRSTKFGTPTTKLNAGWIPVPEKDLPVKLPEVKNYKPTDNGESPLAAITKWVNIKCPKCKGPAKRETDTMPNWAGSSWYYLRYTDPRNNREFASKKNLKYWLGSPKHSEGGTGGVDWYNGGMEHTTLHLLYSRFWHKFLYDLKLVPTKEPYQKRTSHGMILGEGGVKMSKSLGNVINPDDIVRIYGADTLRIYEMFMGPFDESVAWSTESIIGSRRFVEKVWRIRHKVKEEQAKDFPSLRPRSHEDRGPTTLKNPLPVLLPKLLHKTIKKVSEDIENMRFNTAISAMMILATEMEKAENIDAKDYKKFLQILTPFAPHVAEYLWFDLGEKKSVHFSKWPKWDESLIRDDEIKIVVQINGKWRAEVMIEDSDGEDDVKAKAMTDKNVLKYIGKNIKKVIYVKNRLINILSE